MASLYLLIPLGVCVVFAAIAAFVWASSNGQFDEIAAQADRLPDDER